MQKLKRSLFLAGFVVVLLTVVTGGIYAWMYFYNPCDIDAVDDASAFLVIQSKRYDDVYASAASGTRTSLTYPITVLQQILVDTQAVSVPTCMQTAKSELISYMGTVIQAFRAYTTSEEDSTVQNLIYESNVHYDNFYAELDVIRDCAPFCFPH